MLGIYSQFVHRISCVDFIIFYHRYIIHYDMPTTFEGALVTHATSFAMTSTLLRVLSRDRFVLERYSVVFFNELVVLGRAGRDGRV